jgi:hypothetical protein
MSKSVLWKQTQMYWMNQTISYIHVISSVMGCIILDVFYPFLYWFLLFSLFLSNVLESILLSFSVFLSVFLSFIIFFSQSLLCFIVFLFFLRFITSFSPFFRYVSFRSSWPHGSSTCALCSCCCSRECVSHSIISIFCT